jgi:GntR family transcriptional regulator/MocR family aminotransferase
MSKKSSSYELTLPPRGPKTTAQQWLYEAIRSEILRGWLRPGARLPSSRDLGRQYKLARGTIVNAFDQLASEGYLTGSVGSGTYVNQVLPDGLLQVRKRAGLAEAARPIEKPRVSDYAIRARLFRCYEDRPVRAFRPNLPALDMFPIEIWTAITGRCLRRISLRNLMGCDPLGFLPLREAIADYLARSRGVRCAAEQVAIVSGVQEALDLTARLLLNPGDRVCVEDPGYDGAVQVFEAVRARIRRIPVDGDGIAVASLPDRGVRLLYVTPGHQFPVGTTMSLARRLELLAWARRSGAVIFEDDYDSEYRFSGRPIPALQGLATGNGDQGAVLYAGSFSKVMFPALRLGYVVVPGHLVEHFRAALSLTVRHAPVIEQLVLGEFITQGHFGRHIRRMREIYADRHSTLLDEAKSRLAGLMDISGVEAGLQTVGWLHEPLRAEAVAAAASKLGVEVVPIGRYSHQAKQREGLQLGFAAITLSEIRRGVRDLGITLEAEQKRVQQPSQ